MSEQNKRSRGKINAFDVFVIILVLCLVGTFSYKFYKKVNIDSHEQGKEYILSFECDGVYNSISKYIDAGTSVYLSSTGELLGNVWREEKSTAPALSEVTLTSPDFENKTNEVESAEEETKFEYSTAKYTGRISLNKNVYKSADGDFFVLGETNLTVGGTLKIYTNTAELEIVITDIAPISD